MRSGFTGGGGSAACLMFRRSVYVASEARGGGLGWSTMNSAYDESFGAPRDRTPCSHGASCRDWHSSTVQAVVALALVHQGC
jgi:hypothetical protein